MITFVLYHNSTVYVREQNPTKICNFFHAWKYLYSFCVFRTANAKRINLINVSTQCDGSYEHIRLSGT